MGKKKPANQTLREALEKFMEVPEYKITEVPKPEGFEHVTDMDEGFDPAIIDGLYPGEPKYDLTIEDGVWISRISKRRPF